MTEETRWICKGVVFTNWKQAVKFYYFNLRYGTVTEYDFPTLI